MMQLSNFTLTISKFTIHDLEDWRVSIYLWIPANGKKQRKKKSESRSAWKSKAGSSRVATKCANQYKSQHIVWINNLTLRKWTSFALF